MRYVFLLFIMVIILPVYVNAEIIYSDYYLFEKNSNNYYEESDTLIREENIFYLNYHYVKDEEGYYSLNNNPDYLPLVDMEYYIIKNNSDFENEEGTIKEYFIDENMNIKYIKFNNFLTSQTTIKNMSIYSGNELIFYYIYRTNFYYRKIIPENGEIIIDLRDYYPLNSISLIIRFESQTLSPIAYEIGFTNDLTNYQSFSQSVLGTNLKENHKIKFSNEDTNNNNIMYKYYNLKRVDNNIYSKEPLINNEHDLTNYQKQYTYYKRDKVEIIDEINNIDDLIIKYSSTNILGLSNLDLFKNGNQEVTICFINNNCLNKNILVNITDKKINNIQSQEKKGQKSLPKVKNKFYHNDKYQTKIKPQEQKEDEVKLINKKYEKNLVDTKNQSFLGVSIIFYGLIIILSFLIIMKKRKRTNVE